MTVIKKIKQLRHASASSLPLAANNSSLISPLSKIHQLVASTGCCCDTLPGIGSILVPGSTGDTSM